MWDISFLLQKQNWTADSISQEKTDVCKHVISTIGLSFQVEVLAFRKTKHGLHIAQILKTSINSHLFCMSQEGFFLCEMKARTRRVSAIPILKSEAVARYFPNRLVIVRCSLSCQKKVLVKEALLVSFKLHSSTSYHEQCGLALGGLFCENKHCIKKENKI